MVEKNSNCSLQIFFFDLLCLHVLRIDIGEADKIEAIILHRISQRTERKQLIEGEYQI